MTPASCLEIEPGDLVLDLCAAPGGKATALGAAYAAGIAVGFWDGEQDVIDNWSEGKRWEPQMDKDEVERQYRLWKKAVSKTLDWVDEDVEQD